jgi:dihydrofolate reductase
MGRIVVSANVSLDGVMEDPTGEEGLGVGGWFNEVTEADRAAFAEVLTAEALAADALLLAARTYEWFARRWNDRSGVWADRLRELPKHVVTSAPGVSGWGPSTVLGVEDVAKLRESVDGDVVVYASGGLVPTLVDLGLVDEFRLIVYPALLGSGRRLFGPGRRATRLERVDARSVGESLLLLTYGRR